MNDCDPEGERLVRPHADMLEPWYEAHRLRCSDQDPHSACGHRHRNLHAAAACAQRAMVEGALADAGTGGRGPAWGIARVTPSGDGTVEIADVWFLNEYVTRRSYGGPEEGGWHYGSGVFVAAHGEFATREEAEGMLRSAWGREYLAAKRQGLYPPGNVLSTGWPELRVERMTRHDFPAVRPWYC